MRNSLFHLFNSIFSLGVDILCEYGHVGSASVYMRASEITTNKMEINEIVALRACVCIPRHCLRLGARAHMHSLMANARGEYSKFYLIPFWCCGDERFNGPVVLLRLVRPKVNARFNRCILSVHFYFHIIRNTKCYRGNSTLICYSHHEIKRFNACPLHRSLFAQKVFDSI